MTTMSGHKQIDYAQLATVKAALKLEAKGLKHSSGRALRPCWAPRLGLKPRDSYELFIATIQGRMEEILASVQQEAADKSAARPQ